MRTGGVKALNCGLLPAWGLGQEISAERILEKGISTKAITSDIYFSDKM